MEKLVFKSHSGVFSQVRKFHLQRSRGPQGVRGASSVAKALPLFFVALAAGCGNAAYNAQDAQHPSIVLPHQFGEGHQAAQPAAAPPKRTADGKPAPGNGPATATQSASSGTPRFDRRAAVEPPPMQSRDQWEFVFEYRNEQVTVQKVSQRVFDHPVVTQRALGRFAVELWIGRELLERVGFDFPIVGGEDVPVGDATPLDSRTRLAPGAHVQQTLLVPASERATRAELVDSKTGNRQPIPWPPNAPIKPISPD